MIDPKNLSYIVFPLSILTLAYLFVEIPFAVEILALGYGIVALNIIVAGIRFRKIKKQLLELGSIERFNGQLVSTVILLSVVMLFAYFGPQIAQWDIFPPRQETISPYFVTIIAIPQLIRFVMAILLNGFLEVVYITERGILQVMDHAERYEWEDFDSYAMLPDLKLIRFRKIKEDKSDFFFVAYEDKHLNEHKEQILAILDKNLQREIE